MRDRPPRPQQQRASAMRRHISLSWSSPAGVLVVTALMTLVVVRGASAFLLFPPTTGVPAISSSTSTTAAARLAWPSSSSSSSPSKSAGPFPCSSSVARRGGPLRFQLDMGETEESSDFYNPQGIKEGDRVKVLTLSNGLRLYHIPKTPAEGVDPSGFEGEVSSLKIVNRAGVTCSANRPVVVKFTTPYKFMGHFEFRELQRLD